MKTNKGFRDENHADELRKAKRLEPIHKSGKERHSIYRELDDEEDDEPARPKRESAFDYFDDEENLKSTRQWLKNSLRQATRPSMCATPKNETGARSCCTVIWSRCSSGTISSPIFTNRYA